MMEAKKRMQGELGKQVNMLTGVASVMFRNDERHAN
jgi:hypothetical protein